MRAAVLLLLCSCATLEQARAPTPEECHHTAEGQAHTSIAAKLLAGCAGGGGLGAALGPESSRLALGVTGGMCAVGALALGYKADVDSRAWVASCTATPRWVPPAPPEPAAAP